MVMVMTEILFEIVILLEIVMMMNWMIFLMMN